MQEAVNNAIKPAEESTITVTLVLPQTLAALLPLVVEICDNGVGLSTDHPVGIGLHSLRERVQELGRNCLIGNRADGRV